MNQIIKCFLVDKNKSTTGGPSGPCQLGDYLKFIAITKKYIVACQRGAVSEELPWFRAARDTWAVNPLVNPNRWTKPDTYVKPELNVYILTDY